MSDNYSSRGGFSASIQDVAREDDDPEVDRVQIRSGPLPGRIRTNSTGIIPGPTLVQLP